MILVSKRVGRSIGGYLARRTFMNRVVMSLVRRNNLKLRGIILLGVFSII
jgi:hypothetical protein